MSKNECNNKENLEHALKKLRALFDGMDEPIYVSDPDTYEILFANKNLKELYGEKISGKKCYKVFQNLNHPCPFCTNKYIFGENQGKTYIWEFQDRRSKRWYRRIDQAIEWLEGKYVRFEIAIDITEHKQVEEALKSAEQEKDTILNSLVEHVIYEDKAMKILWANQAACESAGLELEKLMGHHCYEIWPKRDTPCPDCPVITALETGQPQQIEKTTPDGRSWFIRGYPVLNVNGDVVGAIEVTLEVTERKHAEEALQDSEKLFRSVVENSHDGILMIDGNFRIVYANDNVERLSGYTKKEIIGQDFRSFLDEDSKALVEKRYLQRRRGKKVPSSYEFKIVRKNGEKRNVELKSTVIRNSKGRIQTVAQLLDITEHKKMEKLGKRFEERLSALHMYAQSLNMTGDMPQVYKLTLDALEKILGFEYASLLLIEGKVLRLVAQRGYSKALVVILPLEGDKGVTVKAVRTGKAVFISDVRNDKTYIEGGFKMLSELAVPIKMKDEVLGVLNVESKRLAAFNDEDKELLEILAAHAAIAMSDIKKHNQLGKISKKLSNLMKSSTEIMQIEDMHQRLKVITEAIRKFGWRRVVISLRDENLEGTAGVTAGLTKEEIKILFERKAPGYIWKERLGPKFERFKIGEFYYLPWSNQWIREYVHKVPPETPYEKATTYAGVPSRLSTKEMIDWHPQDMLYAPLRTPKGRIVGILSVDDPMNGLKPSIESLAPLELFLHQAAMVIENAQLIERLIEARKQLEAHAEQLEQKVEERTSELKKSQKQLLKAQRLAAIGELAGMIGHDLRNPLTAINGAAYYLKKRLSSETDGEVTEMLDLIERNIIYSNKIINDLLDYSGETKLDLIKSNPRSITKKALSLVEIPKNIQVIDLTGNRQKIKVDIGKIKRAFVNIIKNAVDAMPRGGTLTIKSKKSNSNMSFIFSDTGVGISKKTMEKLWTPLFTTKAKGMGFGLSICKRIIESHGGSISVKSARGKGTTFTVTIPIKPKIEGGEKVWIKPLESSLLTTMKT